MRHAATYHNIRPVICICVTYWIQCIIHKTGYPYQVSICIFILNKTRHNDWSYNMSWHNLVLMTISELQTRRICAFPDTRSTKITL